MKITPIKIKTEKKGSAILSAISMATVIAIVIIALYYFSSYRINRATTEEANVIAMAVAEAGLEMALSELYADPSFQTHKVKINTQEDGEDFLWEGELERKANLRPISDVNLKTKGGSKGTYEGQIGAGEFKVRLGTLPFDDNPKTEAIDESKAYIYAESLGKVGDRVRRVQAVINRRFPAREFLMFDGGVLSVVYGMANGSDENVFSIGHLYGHQGLEISRVLMKGRQGSFQGTKQRLDKIDAVLSGDGGIFFYSDVESKFRDHNKGSEEKITISENATFPTSGTYTSAEAERKGEMPEELRNEVPVLPDEIKPWVKNKYDGISIPPVTPAFDRYKEAAKEGGKYYSSGDTQYWLPKNWQSAYGKQSLPVVYLDFGNNVSDAVSQVVGGNAVSKAEVPANGVIYSESDIVIKGNPPKDVTIVSEKNVFVAGDFNHAGNPDNPKHKHGFPQLFEGGPNNADKVTNYTESSMKLYKDDADIPNGEFRHHVMANVVAKHRVVMDYRSPVDCFENELYPMLQYELGNALLNFKPGEENPGTASDNAFLRDASLPQLKYQMPQPEPAEEGEEDAEEDSQEEYDPKEDFRNYLDKHFFEKKGYSMADKDAALDQLTAIFESCVDGSQEIEIIPGKFNEMTATLWNLSKAQYEDSGIKGKCAVDADNILYKLYEGLYEKMKSSDANGLDYLYYPEMTTNGMFISCGKINHTFYAGPDESKTFNEIGNYTQDPSVGHPYKKDGDRTFIHRNFGSEVNLRTEDVVDLPGNGYNPPIRRRIYDDTLATGGEGLSKYAYTSYVVIRWQDTAASKEYYNEF
ncbi:MAG: hypothetical protein GX221_06065 [Candidatus Riflebacteria bacterium]|nr:hypothetical protein [Candidatus Riflebacteria bacterium]